MQIQQQALIEELEIFLDARQNELLKTLDRLGALRAALIRRDESTLTQLLEQVIQDNEQHRILEAEQQRIQQRLARAFTSIDGPLTLSGLCASLDEAHRASLRHKQQTLLELTKRVQRETESTELLLRECARCNRLLLNAILGNQHQATTYNPQGQSQWDVHRGLVSMKL